MAIAGLNLMIPSSVTYTGTSASVSATGKISFDAVTSLSVNDCFTSAYDNYMLSFYWKSDGDRAARMVMRASGTDDTAANYRQQYLYADGSTTGAAQVVNATQMEFAGVGTAYQATIAYMSGPSLVQRTFGRSIFSNSTTAGNTVYFIDRGFNHPIASAYDGFTMTPGAGNFTGQLCIYGIGQ